MRDLRPSKILFNDTPLKSSLHTKQLLKKFASILTTGHFFLGPETKMFETRLKQFLRVPHAIAVASGHDALYLALRALKLKSTDEVIFPVNSPMTAFPAYLGGGKPVPIDVDENGQLDPAGVAKKLTPRTKVIIVVHLYGSVGNFDAILTLVKKHHLVLIEDCAQALGTTFRGSPVGHFGHLNCFSFYPTKNLGTVGDGGAVTAQTKRQAEWLRYMRQYAERRRYLSVEITGHSRIPELQVGALNVYWPDLKKEIAKRRTLRLAYQRAIKHAQLDGSVRLLSSHPKSQPAPHLLVVEVAHRDRLKVFLERKGIPTMIHYPYALGSMPAFKGYPLRTKDFPVASRLHHNILSLPFHPHLTTREIKYIVECMRKFYTR